MSAQPRVARRTTDWFRVLADLQYNGVNNRQVAQRIDVPMSTLRGWKMGASPAHDAGEALLLLWSEVTGHAMSMRPMTMG